MFLLNLILVVCLGTGVTIAVMYVANTLAGLMVWETDIFDNIWPDLGEAQARIAWIITSIFLGVVIAGILL